MPRYTLPIMHGRRKREANQDQELLTDDGQALRSDSRGLYIWAGDEVRRVVSQAPEEKEGRKKERKKEKKRV